MRFAFLTRNIILLSILIIVPVLSYSADFKELWGEKGGTVKEPAKSSNKSLQGASPNEAGQSEEGESAISRQPQQVDRQESAKPSPPIPEPAEVSPKEKVMRVQALLSKLGYDPGPIDGILGERTQAAIRTFQSDIGVQETGELTEVLVVQLAAAIPTIEEEQKDRPQRREYKPESKPSISKSTEALPPIPSRVSNKPLSGSDIYRKVESSIFIIWASSSPSSQDSKLAQGSAVAISARHLVTNCHVINNFPYIFASQGERVLVAHVVLRKEDCDLCVLSIQESSLTPIQGIRKFSDLTIGEEVYSMGAPIGLEKTFTKGMISALRRYEGKGLIQTDAAVSPGSYSLFVCKKRPFFMKSHFRKSI